MNDEILNETEKLLEDLLWSGDFFFSAIEIDTYQKGYTNGEEFEMRIKELLDKIKNIK